MPVTHVALFRGMNVGAAKRVAMKDLAAAIASLGATEVRTLLNSGNAVFAAPRAWRGDPGPRITAAVLARTGVASRVTVLTAAEWGAIARRHPLADPGRSPSRLHVAVPAGAAERAAVAPLARRDWGDDAIALGPRAVYLWCAHGAVDSALVKEIARLLGERVTTRNWATAVKLAALAGVPARG